jgi:hypothetical protein
MERDAGQRTAVLRAAEYLLLVSIDGLIHPREVCAAVGEDYENKPWIFMKARELVNELDGITFAPSGERDGRYRRLASSAGVSYAGKTALKRTRNAANRGRKRIQNALRVANDISDDERRRAGQQITVLGMTEYLTQERIVKQLPDEPEKIDGKTGLKKIILGL